MSLSRSCRGCGFVTISVNVDYVVSQELQYSCRPQTVKGLLKIWRLWPLGGHANGGHVFVKVSKVLILVIYSISFLTFQKLLSFRNVLKYKPLNCKEKETVKREFFFVVLKVSDSPSLQDISVSFFSILAAKHTHKIMSVTKTFTIQSRVSSSFLLGLKHTRPPSWIW